MGKVRETIEKATGKTSSSKPSSSSRFVLACDGGGVRGLVTAQFLYRLEEAAGKPLHELFDMFAGTSVGAIVVSSIACKKAPMSEAMNFYTKDTLESIFHKSIKDRILHKAQGSPTYDGKGKTQYLRKYFGDIVLQDTEKPVLLTAYDIEGRVAVTLRSNEPDPDGKTYTVADACDASSAAPAYFPAKQVNSRWLIDGGVVANNPTLNAYADAVATWPEEEVYIVSLGTGYQIRPIRGEDAQGWGGIQWITQGLLDVVMDETIVVQQARRILGDRLLRVCSDLESASDDMDDISSSNVEALKALGDSWWEEKGEMVLNALRDAGRV